MRLLTKIATVLAQYHQFHATLRELEGYSERELSDLGVSRHDLTRLAWEDAECRFPLPEDASVRPFAKADARSIEATFAAQH